MGVALATPILIEYLKKLPDMRHKNLISLMSFLVVTMLMVTAPSIAEETGEQVLEVLLGSLVKANFNEKREIVSNIAKTGNDMALPVLKKMLDGELYYRKQDNKPVLAVSSNTGYILYDVISGEELGEVGRRDARKVRINNSIRGLLKLVIARLSLDSKDPAVRLSAVEDMLGNLNPESESQLRKAANKESNTGVKEAMQEALALYDLDSPVKENKMAALKTLSVSLSSEVQGKIRRMLAKDEDGNYPVEDRDIIKQARLALDSIESRLKMYSYIETTFFGLSLGSVLLLIAVGLAITLGVMGVINMAHGELMMIGAYTTYVVQLIMPNYIGASLFVAIPAAFVVSGVVGIIIERFVIRHLHGRPLETLLATFGISLILQQLVRSIFSSLNRSVKTPDWMSGALEINGALSLTYNRIYIILFALLVFVALLLVLKKTALGLQVRAVKQNRNMAKAMGIKTERVDALTFGLGSGIAGVAGVALSQLTNVGPNLGQTYIVDSFMVVVFGGVGNLWGTLVSAMSLGVVNKYLEPWAGAVLAKIIVLTFIILFIQRRPRGLFPQKGRAAEN